VKRFNTWPLSAHLLRILSRSIRQNTWSLRVWHEFIHHSQTHGSFKLLSRLLTVALRFHSNCAGLWIYTASLENETHVRHGFECSISI